MRLKITPYFCMQNLYGNKIYIAFHRNGFNLSFVNQNQNLTYQIRKYSIVSF